MVIKAVGSKRRSLSLRIPFLAVSRDTELVKVDHRLKKLRRMLSGWGAGGSQMTFRSFSD